MITLKFPKIETALQKANALKDEPLDSPLRGIIVLNQKAMVFNMGWMIVIDLYDYFTLECGIEDDEELTSLEGILMYMNGKVFSSDYWSELTKGANMQMKQGALEVENPRFSKDLHYKALDINIIEPLAKLTTANSLEESIVGSIAINFGVLNSIYKILPTDFKLDDIIFQFASQDQYVKFTFRKRKHIYGYIKPNYGAAQESFRFDNMENFVYEFQPYLEKLRLDNTPAPPPETISDNSKIDNEDTGQLKIVE